mmetsp:Transcript_71874/g.194448  ORF Transcript_71874/g.194448 Transcript_71874/m.194448 type:complete len:136 (+) Transcript_71874:141-548(+)
MASWVTNSLQNQYTLNEWLGSISTRELRETREDISSRNLANSSSIRTRPRFSSVASLAAPTRVSKLKRDRMLVTLFASPEALGFYRALGFHEVVGEDGDADDDLQIPMARLAAGPLAPGRRLGEAPGLPLHGAGA